MFYFMKTRDSRGEWRWSFHATNGETIAVSSEGYTHEAGCDNGIALVKRGAPGAEVRRRAA